MYELPGQSFVYVCYLNVPTTRKKKSDTSCTYMPCQQYHHLCGKKKIITVFMHQNNVFCKGFKLGDIWVQCAKYLKTNLVIH